VIEYVSDPVDTGPQHRLAVDPDGEGMWFEISVQGRDDDVLDISLPRDSVAALAAQLQSWLARTAVPEAT
jgi:hypothetical protein